MDILFLKLKTEIDDESLSFCVRNYAKLDKVNSAILSFEL